MRCTEANKSAYRSEHPAVLCGAKQAVDSNIDLAIRLCSPYPQRTAELRHNGSACAAAASASKELAPSRPCVRPRAAAAGCGRFRLARRGRAAAAAWAVGTSGGKLSTAREPLRRSASLCSEDESQERDGAGQLKEGSVAHVS